MVTVADQFSPRCLSMKWAHVVTMYNFSPAELRFVGFFFLNLIFMCMCASPTCLSVMFMSVALRVQKKGLDPMDWS